MLEILGSGQATLLSNKPQNYTFSVDICLQILLLFGWNAQQHTLYNQKKLRCLFFVCQMVTVSIFEETNYGTLLQIWSHCFELGNFFLAHSNVSSRG